MKVDRRPKFYHLRLLQESPLIGILRLKKSNLPKCKPFELETFGNSGSSAAKTPKDNKIFFEIPEKARNIFIGGGKNLGREI